jgi:archaemetzincin
VRLPENGQNMAQFRQATAAAPVPSGGLRVGTLAGPLSERQQRLVPLVAEFTALFFQREVKEAQALALPESAQASRRGSGTAQYDAGKILAGLAGRCTGDAIACLRLTGEDLYIPGLQYVFGLAHYRHRQGVVSLHRIWEPRHDESGQARRGQGRAEPLRRLLKIASHELSHQFSIAHCVHYRRCLMAGTSSTRENDEGRLALCPLDFEKLRQRLGFDPHGRFRQLAAFATRNKLYPEARYWEQMAGAD